MRMIVAGFLAPLCLLACSDGTSADEATPVTTPATESAPAPTEAPNGKPPASRPNAPEPPTPAPAVNVRSGPKVVFLGDSLSAGLHLPAREAFPAVLQRRLAARGTPFQLINAGVSGDTSAGGLRRVDWVLKQQPDIVVIELGANDGLRGVPVEAVEDNLRGIIEKVRAADAEPLLLGMRLPPSYGKPYADAFDAIYPRLAEAMNVPLVPFFMDGVAGNPDLNLPDGLHPTTRGHELLADNIEDALAEVLKPAAQPD